LSLGREVRAALDLTTGSHMLVTQDAEGISIDLGDMDEDEMIAAIEHFQECLEGWDGEPKVLIAAVIRIIDEIVSEAMGPTQ
jgi:hypothetical protein